GLSSRHPSVRRRLVWRKRMSATPRSPASPPTKLSVSDPLLHTLEVTMTSPTRQHTLGIWLCALGYFLTYIPYSALIKTVTSGLWHGTPVSGFELLIPAAGATLFVEFSFISIMGWWRYLP